MSQILTRILVIAAAGALGALCRWGATVFVESIHETKFRFGTLVVNVVGCLLFGFLIEFFADRIPDESHWRTFLLIGFLGSFTTFSTFAHDTHMLHDKHGLMGAFGNVALNVVLGWGAVVLGVLLGKAIS